MIKRGKEITYKLPESIRQGYQELEYIESTGTQYIKTGLTNRKYYLHRLEIGFNNKSESGMICGATPSRAYFVLQEGTNCYTNTGGQTQGEGKVQVNTYYNYVFDGQSNHQQCYLNGELANETTYQYDNVVTSIELYIFCRFGGTGAENFKSTKIYYFKIYDENRVLIRDYVPAKRKSDNAIGLYDMVNETFFTNAGTGTFSYGELQSESEITDVKMGDTQIDSVYLGTKEIWSNFKVPYSRRMNFSSSNHYSMSCSFDTNDLARIVVTKFVVCSTTRRMQGDSYVDARCTTKKGTNWSKNSWFSDGTRTEKGTLDGIPYTLTGYSANDTGRYTMEFAKPIKLSTITGGCGSGVGQWRETDKMYIEVTGLSKE